MVLCVGHVLRFLGDLLENRLGILPHLVVPVVTDPKKVILALRWVVNEMEKRYQIFARVGVRNIGSFNSRPKNKPLPQQELELPLMAKKPVGMERLSQRRPAMLPGSL